MGRMRNISSIRPLTLGLFRPINRNVVNGAYEISLEKRQSKANASLYRIVRHLSKNFMSSEFKNRKVCWNTARESREGVDHRAYE